MSTNDPYFTCTLLDYVCCPKCRLSGLVVGGGNEWCQREGCDYHAPERRVSWSENEYRHDLAREMEAEAKSLRAIAILDKFIGREDAHDKP